MEKLMTIKGKRIILNVQYSKIGFGYPRIFVEVNENDYLNLDLTLGAAFKMKKEDFADWLTDAEAIPEETYQTTLEESNLNYERFLEYLDSLE